MQTDMFPCEGVRYGPASQTMLGTIIVQYDGCPQAISASKVAAVPMTASHHVRSPSSATNVGAPAPPGTGGRHARTPSLPGPHSPSATLTSAEASGMSSQGVLDPRMLMLMPSAIGGLRSGGRISADGAATAVAYGASLLPGGKGAAGSRLEPTQSSGLFGQLDPLHWLLQELVNLLLVLCQVS